jgi:hypothetical protein
VLVLFSALNLEVIHVGSKPVTEVLILFSALSLDLIHMSSKPVTARLT